MAHSSGKPLVNMSEQSLLGNLVPERITSGGVSIAGVTRHTAEPLKRATVANERSFDRTQALL